MLEFGVLGLESRMKWPVMTMLFLFLKFYGVFLGLETSFSGSRKVAFFFSSSEMINFLLF